jgi:hypothetical protein
LIGGAAEEWAMMGRQNAPEKLFYQFRLEDHIPSDHPLRQLMRYLILTRRERFWLSITALLAVPRLILN